MQPEQADPPSSKSSTFDDDSGDDAAQPERKSSTFDDDSGGDAAQPERKSSTFDDDSGDDAAQPERTKPWWENHPELEAIKARVEADIYGKPDRPESHSPDSHSPDPVLSNDQNLWMSLGGAA
ncbi:MAG: hypothetical protein K0U80_08145 [Actinomycetia bacterium]|nr:hypothetical protein [Actinomycetes bacterium]MCH9759858.1 hypothetical protein [Actinomycetes bacterium]